MRIKKIAAQKINLSPYIDKFLKLITSDNNEFNEDIIDKYVDNNFFHNMLDDICNMDIMGFLNPYLKSLIYFIFTNDEKSIIKKNESEIAKIYNCTHINYDKPITYKYFKNVALTTIPLNRIVFLIAELALYAQEIKEIYEKPPLCLYAEFDTKKFIMLTINAPFSDALDYGTKSETLDFFMDNPQFYNMFGKAKQSLPDYWYWLFIYYYFDEFCRIGLKNMSEISKMYAWESFKASENKPCLYKEDEIALKALQATRKSNLKERTAHNAYTKEEKLVIYKAKQAYKTVTNMYKFMKLVSNILNEKLNYKSAMNKLEKLALDKEYNMFIYGLGYLYNCSHNCTECQHRKGKICLNMPKEEILFDKLKEFSKKYLTVIYNITFKNNNSFKKISSYFNSISKQDFALMVIKDIYPFFADKSNKTIINIFSMEDNIANEEEYFKRYKEAFFEKRVINNETEILIRSLHTISDALELYLKSPTQDKKVFLLMNIKQIQALPFLSGLNCLDLKNLQKIPSK